MKKKKILIYIHQGILKGGVEKVFHNLLNNLPVDKYEITVLSVMGYLNNDFNTQLYPSFVTRHCFMWDEFSKKSCFKRIWQKIHNRIFPFIYRLLLKFKKFDVAIAAQEGFYADFVANNVNAKRKLLWIHNDISQCHWSLNYFGNVEKERECYNKFNNIICVSQGVAESMEIVFGKMDNLSVCYNPIDTHEIDNKLKDALPSRPSAAPWFVCVGRLAHQKGYDRLIKVCHQLNKEGYRYDISILGEGEDRHKLENMLQDLHLTNIHFLGNQPNPFKYVKSADWLLLPSRHEGFGMVLHEAIYCQTPAIATNVCGAKELLGESEYGIVIENSERGIYYAMKAVLDEPTILEKYTKAVKQRVPFVDLQKRVGDIQAIIDKEDELDL